MPSFVRRTISATTGGCTILPSRARAESSRKTMAPSASRSSAPSAVTTPSPKASAISRTIGVFGACSSCTMASASIPVAFPPQMIQVEADGELYDEMHVDGGVTRQSFLFSFHVDDEALTKRLGAVGQTRVFVIRNSRLAPQWKTVDRSIVDISGRTVGSLIRTQGIGDLYREYSGAAAWGFDYNFAYISSDFDPGDAKDGFNVKYMNALYQFGYGLAKEGYPWEKAPPGLLPQ